MKKSKRERQVDLLEKLLNRLSTSEESTDTINTNTDWVHRKISEVKGGDVDLDSGGLTRDDMILANGIWNKHASPFLKQ